MKQGKKWIALLLVIAVCSTLTACGDKEDSQIIDTSAEPAQAETTPETETSTEPSPATAAQPETEPQPTTEEPEQPENTYYAALTEAALAADSSLELPREDSLLPEGETTVRYVQGTYGQGIYLCRTPGGGMRSLLKDGETVTVLAMEEDSAFVRVADGRYGWAHSQYLEEQFDETLSFERKRDYVISDSSYWTAPEWTSFILDNADEFPAEVVAAAQGAVNG